MAQYNMGYCYFNAGDMESAAKAFEEFLKVRTLNDEYRADAYNRMGDVHYSKREFAKALQYYDRAIASNATQRYYAEYQRAITLGVQNKRSEKIAALRAIVSADKGDFVDAAALQERVQLPGSHLGVLVEHLIEVTQAEKQNTILVALFYIIVLPPHGGQFICRFCHRLNLFL